VEDEKYEITYVLNYNGIKQGYAAFAIKKIE
jgi:hypothetical protein